jgi:riboflavin synthase
MFTGLIREIAKVESFIDGKLRLISNYKPKIGDSIAVNGVCLTVIEVFDRGFVVEVADETRAVVDESKFKGKVHIEPAMQMGDRFEGHIVQGHIDCMGEVIKIVKLSKGVDYYIKVPKEQIKYIIPKGSITIDGVSLTVNDVFEDSFRLTIIPHTLENTLIKYYKVGTKVNIETDFFARYIEHILSRRDSKKGLSWGDIDRISMSY